MILQALVGHYEDLNAVGKISPFGWAPQKISFAVYLNENGSVEQITPLQMEATQGKKTVQVPQVLTVPMAVKKTTKITSNFLWENPEYIFGLSTKGKPERAEKCFEACRDLHEELLQGVDQPAASALLRFFRMWDPKKAAEDAKVKAVIDKLMDGGNLVFRYSGKYLHEIPEIREVWEAHYASGDGTVSERCLVTGKTGPIATLHPSIKGIQGAQSSGASLVSFNAPAFCSYGREKGNNAPTGVYAAYAYAVALNDLIADKENVQRVGDTTVLCWAKGGEPAYQGLMGCCVFGKASAYDQAELAGMVHLLAAGKSVTFEETRIDPEKPFYILGISPNAARLSVRFFMCNTFGNIIKNVDEHNKRMEIAGRDKPVSIGRMLFETVNQNSRDKSPMPQLAGETLRSILTGGYYPAGLLIAVTLRIRAEHSINSVRAAIIKAFYLKNTNPFVPEEVLEMHLNPDSSSVPYQLGRLFSVLESIQQAANPLINTTIRDKYFNAASATPAVVFPLLVNLAQKHLRKIGGGLQITLERQLMEIIDKLGEEYPSQLSLPEQGAFQLGYYQQNVVRYSKKED